jgi:3-hydroxyethyl bacteriochlorophyllide a dehydrogenase
VVVDVEYTGISTGTERLLYTGHDALLPGARLPARAGLRDGGARALGGRRERRTGASASSCPGAYSFTEVKNLFGGAARTLVAPGTRAIPVGDELAAESILLALGATAMHAITDGRDARRAPRSPTSSSATARSVASSPDS